MIKVCTGCGANIQSIDKKRAGYLKEEIIKSRQSFLCERCFKLIHYNELLDIEYNEEVFLNNTKIINESRALVLAVVDVFDLEGTLIKDLSKLFPNNKIYLIGNKFDLFLKSVNVNKVRNYLKTYLERHKIFVDKIILMSSFRKDDLIDLLEDIVDYQTKSKKDVYFVGMTNVGKSSIINGLTKLINPEGDKKLTVSNTISTTLGFIKIPTTSNHYLIDTPGIINNLQATYYLDADNLNSLSPKKYIKPKVFQLDPNQALFIGGFAVVKFLEGSRSSFVVNMPSNLVIHRTKAENSDDFYNSHKNDILKIPNESEVSKLGNFKKYKFTFDEKKIDITISGLGFITLIGKGIVEVLCFEKIKVSVRAAIY